MASRSIFLKEHQKFIWAVQNSSMSIERSQLYFSTSNNAHLEFLHPSKLFLQALKHAQCQFFFQIIETLCVENYYLFSITPAKAKIAWNLLALQKTVYLVRQEILHQKQTVFSKVSRPTGLYSLYPKCIDKTSLNKTKLVQRFLLFQKLSNLSPKGFFSKTSDIKIFHRNLYQLQFPDSPNRQQKV